MSRCLDSIALYFCSSLTAQRCRECAETPSGATLIKFWIIKHSTQTTRSLCLTGPVVYFSFHSASSELPAVVGNPADTMSGCICVSLCVPLLLSSEHLGRLLEGAATYPPAWGTLSYTKTHTQKHRFALVIWYLWAPIRVFTLQSGTFGDWGQSQFLVWELVAG